MPALLEINIGEIKDSTGGSNSREIADLLDEAIRLLQSGRLLEAANFCEHVRRIAPNNLTALLLSGTIELQAGRYQVADQLFQIAQVTKPDSVDAATGRANALRAIGKHDQALAVLDAIVRQTPDHAIVWNNRGNLLLETGRSLDAIENYDRAISLQPNYSEAWHNRGVARMASGDNIAAEADLTRALELNPDYVQALVNRGVARTRQNPDRVKEAITDLKQAISLDKTNPDAWYRLGQTYFMLRQYDEALASWSTGLASHPNYAPMLHSRGFLFNSLGRYPNAVSDFERLVSLHSGDARAWQGRGIALARLNHNEQAIASFSQALSYTPNDVLSLYNRAAIFSFLKRYREAISDLEALIALDPEFPLARGLLLNTRLHLCDWRDLEQQCLEINACLKRGARVIHPSTHLLISDRPDAQLACARLEAAGSDPSALAPLYRGEKYGHNNIRVAYLSSDFYQHATAYLMAGVLENHDRDRFEIFGISYGSKDESSMRGRIKKACTQFFDVPEQDDASIAALLRKLEVDIAIDLKGRTGHARPGILAYRPCPVQVHYLGYPGTTGAEYIDYLIADRIVIPPETRQYYSERIVYLPDTYQPNDSARLIAPDPITRRDAGLPEAAFVFCCFNGSQKILPFVFNSWMRILSHSENSVLWLLEDNQDATTNLRREATARGIAAERLIFAQHQPLDRHLARLKLADLVLDTLPYGAHTTASDALWAGVPVLTRIGPTFAGRVAASLLTAVGLPELITQSVGEYEKMAEHFAAAPWSLSPIQEKLARSRGSCPLFDTVLMTRNLEAAYVEMLKRHHSGKTPEHIALC